MSRNAEKFERITICNKPSKKNQKLLNELEGKVNASAQSRENTRADNVIVER